MFRFFSKSKSSLGIDIGTTSIKMVQLGKEGDRIKLETYGFIENYSRSDGYTDAIQSSSLKMLDSQVAEMIKTIVKEAKATTNEATISIPIFSSFTTVMELPSMSEKEIASSIPYQARQYIPVPISDVVLDWEIIKKPSNSDKEGKIEVLLIAVPKEIISKYSRIAKLANLNLQALEVETFGLVRSLLGNDKSPVVLVDLGARSTGISIVDGGAVRIVYNLDTAGEELTQAVKRSLNLDLSRAETLKRDVGLLKEADGRDVSRVLSNITDIIISEIERLGSLYEKKARKMEKVIISGGGANLLGLIDYMIEKLGMEVIVGDPFSRIAYPAILKPALKEIGPIFSIAVGLAMRPHYK